REPPTLRARRTAPARYGTAQHSADCRNGQAVDAPTRFPPPRRRGAERWRRPLAPAAATSRAAMTRAVHRRGDEIDAAHRGGTAPGADVAAVGATAGCRRQP